MRQHTATKLIVLVAGALFLFPFFETLALSRTVEAAPNMSSRFVRLASADASATTTHVVGFSITQPAVPLGSVEIEYCSNDPLPGNPCTAPTGFDLTSASLGSQTGNTGFSIDPSSTSNRILLTRFAALPSGAASTYQFNNVVNPDTAGTYYVRLRTFATTDGSGAVTEEGGIAFAINSGVNIAAEVPPYLKFCAGITIVGYDCSTATSFFIDLGEFSSNATAKASSELVMATNAQYGLNITVTGTTLTSGNTVIDSIPTGAPSTPGVSQFGMNLRANSNPGIGADPQGPGSVVPKAEYNSPNTYRFNTNEVIASSSAVSDERKLTLSYITNINPNQAPGVYATTLSFICLANF